MKTIFEKSQKGQYAYSLQKEEEDFLSYHPPKNLLRKTPISLPEISEIDLTRHFSQLAQKNMGIDTNFYPLGSCTMKLNPRINEICASLTGFVRNHPLAPEESVQGCLQVIYELIEFLNNLCGMEAGTLAPCAGAQGEFIGIRMIDAYHKERNDFNRDEILVPDSAHGTNPATATLAGFKSISIRTNLEGDLDLEDLKNKTSSRTAGLMLTNPNTLGLFSKTVLEVSEIVHEKGGLLYYDGANLNAIMHFAKPGDMGFDVMHLNLHKTFSTPHGGGGPGSGPVLCKKKLEPFLPLPKIVEKNNKYNVLWNSEKSIGKISTFFGNFSIYLRAYLYIKLHGHFGLNKISKLAVLNANYLKKRMEGIFTIPYPQICMHEFVVQADNYIDKGIRALDIAKRLLDYGFYAPTIYFPLTIKECMLIEPTESESKDTLDSFIEAIESIVKEIEKDPAFVKGAPYTLSVGRLDEVRAAKNPILKN